MTIRKRTWKGPNGEIKVGWVADYKDASGKRCQPQFEKKKDAEAHYLKAKTEISAGTHLSSANITTIAKLCRKYLEYSEGRARDGRIGLMRHRSIDMAVRNSIIPNIGGMKVPDLTPVRVEHLYEEMCTRGKLAPKSARYRLQMLKQIYDFAIKHGLAKVNPVPAGIRELRGVPTPKIRTFKPDEINRLLLAARTRLKGDHHHAHKTMNLLVNIAAFCGLRFGEIMGLKPENIDFNRRLILVRNSLSRMDGLKAPKTAAGKRDIPMPTHIAVMLREYINEFYKPNPLDLIIRTSKGGNLLATTFHCHHWPQLLSRAGLLDDGERYHFHALRHFAASWMIENGLPVTDVAMLLGHSKFDLTLQIYAHPIVGGSHRHEAIERMSRALIEAPVTIDAAYTQHGAKSLEITMG